MAKASHGLNISRALTVLGLAVVLLTAMFIATDTSVRSIAEIQIQMVWIGVGLLINQIGVWNLANKVFTKRHNHALRQEVDDFIGHVRILHGLSGDVAAAQRDGILSEMHASVERMAQLVPSATDAPGSEEKSDETEAA